MKKNKGIKSKQFMVQSMKKVYKEKAAFFRHLVTGFQKAFGGVMGYHAKVQYHRNSSSQK